MSGSSYQPPAFRNILIGIVLAGALVFLLVGALAQVVKWAGQPFLILPSMLGLTGLVMPADVQHASLNTLGDTLQFNHAGRYALYTSNWDLLELTEKSLQQQRKPWLVITSQMSGTEVPVSYVERGLRPYDTPFAPGRPVMTFVIPAFGFYTVRHPDSAAGIALAPDYTTGREAAVAWLMAAQAALVALSLAVVSGQRYARRRTVRQAEQEARRQAADAFWQGRARGAGRR